MIRISFSPINCTVDCRAFCQAMFLSGSFFKIASIFVTSSTWSKSKYSYTTPELLFCFIMDTSMLQFPQALQTFTQRKSILLLILSPCLLLFDYYVFGPNVAVFLYFIQVELCRKMALSLQFFCNNLNAMISKHVSHRYFVIFSWKL